MALLASQAVVAAAVTEAPISLTITGDAGATVRGRCTVGRASGQEVVVELDGPVPIERRLEGGSLACDLEAVGTVVVEVERAGNRSRTSTRDGRVRVTVG